MVFNSLTDIPRNPKEAVDWLVALKGADAEKNLAAMGKAVYDLLADKPVGFTDVTALWNVKFSTKKFLQKDEIKDMWPANELIGRYFAFMDKSPEALAKKVASGLTADSMVKNVSDVVDGCEMFLEKIKVPGQYKSAYSGEATWESSCAKNPEACAVVLVGIAPMLYVGLGSLWSASHAEMSKQSTGAGEVLKVLGFVEPQCRADSASSVLSGLRGVDLHILDTLYDLAGFWAFY
ncbi:hypothetical protein, conserved [Babesia ovata]|uniref:Uncharacterized protein n=1 Tax=Babesia ovata TaxID=189622 RepID=A0A2H6KFD6_9APIC|nr:uncharacterized protein BOVATA_032060 [Babesia ovata]GBE61713.1 hypothetical protein, conserved [Babesia ovata]